jgi:hypothetical protein
LDFDRRADRVDDAREFREHAVAGRLDDAAAVLPDLRVDELAAMRLEAFEGAFLVRSLTPILGKSYNNLWKSQPLKHIL